MRIIDTHGVVSVIEPADHQAGITGDSFKMKNTHHADILFTFGAITGDSILSLYVGATAAALTTKIAFRHRLASGAYKAASADLWASSDTTDADGDLTLTAATYKNKQFVIMLDGAELDEAKPWVTVDVDATASVLLMSATALLTPRYAPALTAIA